MSFVLKQDGVQIAVSGGWNPTLFGNLTNTSFPQSVDTTFHWTHEGYELLWEDDPP